MRWQIRPLGPWAGPVTADRKSSGTFKAPWDLTLALLDAEVETLAAEGLVVIQIDVEAMDLRADGMLRTRARIGDFPGVRGDRDLWDRLDAAAAVLGLQDNGACLPEIPGSA